MSPDLLSKLICSVFSRLLGISQLSSPSELTDYRLIYFIARAACDFYTVNLRAKLFFGFTFFFLFTNGTHLRSLLFGLIFKFLLKLCINIGAGTLVILYRDFSRLLRRLWLRTSRDLNLRFFELLMLLDLWCSPVSSLINIFGLILGRLLPLFNRLVGVF